MPSPSDARSLDPVAAVPAHELVLAQLRRSIHLGHFGAGDRLPPERELARQLGVSRTTVREAVRVLEGEGLVEIKRGSSGGISCGRSRPAPAELRRRLREFEEIIEFRLAVEPMAARLAAQRRTKTDLARARPRPSSGSRRSPRRAPRAPSPTGCAPTASTTC